MDTQPLLQSKSCRGVSFEMNVNIDRLLTKTNSTLKVISEAKETTSRQYSVVVPKLAKVRTLISERYSRTTSNTYRSISRLGSTSFDYGFGQLPENDDEFDQDNVDTETVQEDVPLMPSLSDPSSKPAAASAHHYESKSRLGTILLQQSWFSVYKRLFAVSVSINSVFLILAATGQFNYAKSRAALLAIVNILMLVLVRNEVFLRVVFWLTLKLFGHSWIPVVVKNSMTAFLQSLGGIHSGCGVSSMMWVTYAIEETLRHRYLTSDEIYAIAIAIQVLLLLSCLGAFPLLRHLHHNIFEYVHRFAGWGSLGLLWVFIILSASYDPLAKSYSVRCGKLVKRQELWYTAVTTFLILLPWLTVRKALVETIIPEARNSSLLNFSGGVKPGILARISRSPLSDWHTFGIISDGKQRHTILAGAVGDFTKGLVECPPSRIWVRTFQFAGLPYLVNMYNRAVVVATGSGICVFMSFLLQRTRADVHVIWIAKNIQKSYGDEIFQVVTNTPASRFSVFDTAISGRRPKTAEIVINKAREWGAEVVIVTSNPIGTNEIVGSCRKAGIPAFGPIWDS
ncbi:hypothetical protein O6H91_Y555900 [Diphasiastrum complanatum]|nr:hypothetical protein O6H91_Y555900 [Diphasiastrum complanatum]